MPDGEGRLTPVHHVVLIGHPDNAADLHRRVAAAVTPLPDGSLAVAFAISGGIDTLHVPTPECPAPADALWSTTCCELFVASDETPGYREFNFSPSGQWAVYDFSAYRERTAARPGCPTPTIVTRSDVETLRLDIELPASALPAAGALQLGLSAVLEAHDGRLGYWALAHAPGKPDFHHPTAFALAINKECQ